jgi:hypothetical protein
VLLLEASNCLPEPAVPKVKPFSVLWGRGGDQKLSTLIMDLNQRVQGLLVPPFFDLGMVDADFLPLILPSIENAGGEFLLHFSNWEVGTQLGELCLDRFLETSLINISSLWCNSVEGGFWRMGGDVGDQLLVV